MIPLQRTQRWGFYFAVAGTRNEDGSLLSDGVGSCCRTEMIPIEQKRTSAEKTLSAVNCPCRST